MLAERIKTSLVMPKLIFAGTIFLFVMAGAMAVVLATNDPATILSESAKIEDSIRALVIPGA